MTPEELRECVRQLPVAMWVTDEELTVRSVTYGPRVNYFQRPASASLFPGRNFSFATDSASLTDTAAHMRAKRGETVSWRMGRSGELLACITPIRDADNTVCGVAGVAVDISEFEEQANQRDLMRGLFSSLANTIDHSVHLRDEQGNSIFTNAPFEEGMPASSQQTFKSGSGTLILSVESGGGRRAPDGRGHDSGEERNDNAAAELRWLIETARDAQVMLLSDGRIFLVNSKWVELFGGASSHYEGTNFTQWVSQECMQEFLSLASSRVPVSAENVRMAGVDDFTTVGTLNVFPNIGPGSSGKSLWTFSAHAPASPARDVVRFKVSDLDGRILELLALGCSNAEISERASLSRQGLDYRIKILKKTLSVDSRGALVAKAYHIGLLKSGDWPPHLHKQGES
ncbi:PAS domain-containing protein [Streptomyces sp. 900105245]